ncbi:hypothetical protein [Cellulomonas sp. JH27-2]|nr:hypothetical protein [Cellulomonas sp. JH27-2]
MTSSIEVEENYPMLVGDTRGAVVDRRQVATYGHALTAHLT